MPKQRVAASAVGWLEFVATLILGAVLVAILGGALSSIQTKQSEFADSAAGSQGAEWFSQWVTWLPLWIVLLAMFGLIVTVVVRRDKVLG